MTGWAVERHCGAEKYIRERRHETHTSVNKWFETECQKVSHGEKCSRVGSERTFICEWIFKYIGIFTVI